MSVTFKNTSNYTWSNSVQLAVDNTQNQAFLVKFNNNWVSTYRIANLPVASVAPGATVTFTFNIKIPNIARGRYQFFVRLVDNSHGWFTPDINGGAWWYVTVQ